jgi:hypothetical protein
MTRPRITIAQLMAIVLFLGLGLAALINDRRKNAEIANLSALIVRQEQEFNRQRGILTTIIDEQCDQLETRRNTFELPHGYVSAVDDVKREVLINITFRQGARPGMKMAIFDAAYLGLPNEKLKATIVLSQVGKQSSTARLLEANNSVGPVRVGDIVLSPAWSPGNPTRFALIGKIDINRDGKDDRDELKRIIDEAGGMIEFDHPPPDVGKETGTLRPRIDWYVTDDRTVSPKESVPSRMREVIKEARHNGIRPISIERLLALLGHRMGEPEAGPRRSTFPWP